MSTEQIATARLTVDVVLIGRRQGADHVLLIERGWEPFAGRWALPGGHVDVGEDTTNTAASAARELAEETGIDIAVDDLVPVGTWAQPGRDPRGRYSTDVWTTVVAGTPAPAAGDDATAARWVPVDDVLADAGALAFDHLALIVAAVNALEFR
ncbi:transcriptional regulator [Amycolatopsis antarctica]|uniref:Transcriptional regulator n=1 Tax=Amycolatopsis antarctica TaxID=1854586 RepID=A0A263CUV6_9PSEU|nr:NUDIX hydrolase [Amycolatopsis antarctica]OZM69913.1 transcriptional regulator [Amycolatopsis antarctica]